MKFKVIASSVKCNYKMARNQGKKENRKCYVTFIFRKEEIY